MAIKRTIKRQNLVRPVAMDTSSGALAMAQATQNIANTVSNVTKFVDDNQFQDTVLKAEIAGRQIGSETITDAQGNKIPKPLDQMSLNSFTADIYNKANLRKAQQYFKKEAINSYGLSLQNHAQDVANQSYLENEGKIDETGKLIVTTAGESYINGIKGTVSPEVFNVISPTLSNIWGKATRKASAKQIADVKASNLFNAEKALNNMLTIEINNISNGGTDEDLEYIETNKPRIFEMIDNNASSSVDAEKAKAQYNQALQTGVATNAVDMAYEANVSISQLLEMAIDTRKSFANDPNIDGDKVANAMKNKIAIYEAQETDARQEKIRISTEKKHKLELNLYKNIPVSDNEINELDIKDQVSFLKARATYQKSVNTNISKVLNDNISLKISAVKNDLVPLGKITEVDFANETPLILRNRGKVEQINELTKNLNHKDVNVTNKKAIIELNGSLAKETLKISNDAYVAQMERMFDGNESVPMINPSELLKPEYIRSLKDKKIIGVGNEFAYSEKSWSLRVLRYRDDYIKKQIEVYEMSKIGINQDRGIGLSVVQKQTLEDKILPKTFVYDGAEVNYDILSPNEGIRNASIDFYSKTIQSFGYIPRNLMQTFNSIRTLKDENFSLAKMTYATIKQNVIMKYGKEKRADGESAFEQIVSDSGVNSTLMDSAMFYDSSDNFRTAHQSQSINRSLSEYFRIDGKTDDEVFDDGFNIVKEYLDSNFFTQFFTTKVGGDPYENSALKAFVAQSGVNNFEDAIIKDPKIKNEMIKFVKYQITTGSVSGDADGLNTAIKKSFYKLAPHLSIHEDTETGQAYLIRGNSIVREAQTTVPTGGPTVTKEIITKDMLRDYNQSFGGGSQDPVVQEAIDNGNIMFIGNDDGVGNQTYRVVAVTGDGRFETLANNYRWNYQGSEFESDYYRALKKIQNEPVRQILNSFNFMSKNVLDQTMSKIAASRNYAEGFKSLVNSYNSIAGSINRAKIEYTSILPYLKLDGSQKDLDGYFDEFMALGFTTR